MRALMLSTAFLLAAAALPAAPAQAGDDGAGFGFVSGGSAFNGDSRRHDRRRLRGTDTVIVYDRGYQGDTAWRAESFNDWWHERPNRSYPAWVQRNRDCQRPWWQGETLTC
ncbi:MAG TPA: hypothetical protein VFO32_00105 [Sphingomicrobium sp.]|jgi:hypothetical protein|nr:hypothetical protein [Sphingomicrobium sp.]